jgi:hypothetical protein
MDLIVVPKTSREDHYFRTQEITASVARQVGRFFSPDVRVAAVFAVIRTIHMRW